MAEPKLAPAAGSEDVEVFVSASEDEAVQQQVVTPELLSALVKQVEFYFSDANLPTDKKLLKQIRKDPEGFVPVKLFANFRKVRALSKDVGIITEALRGASLLQLSQDCKRVKRIMPVPEYDISDIQRRTIVVENLPGNPSPTIESVTEMFRLYGRVKLVRICSRESKGKLPSWLTGSCQNMGGQQHAYVEFEEEEGAILAAAALAQESDAPDGAVQVRRLLACIAEQRERRSVNGAGSSYGGSTSGGGGCSRKGSRDVSPMASSRSHVGSRRNSGGGAPYGNSYSCGGNSWGPCSSGGGAAIDSSAPFHNSYHAYHSYGGAFEHGGGSSATSRRGSGGGAGMSPALAHLPPPPPPPPRRSCDSAPASDLLPPATIPTPTLSARASNVYRPPAKRLSDGYGPAVAAAAPPATGSQPPPPPLLSCPSPSAAMAAPISTTGTTALMSRSLGGSFNSSCGGSNCSAGGMSALSVLSTAPCSTASTPVGVLSSPALAVVPSPPVGPMGYSSSPSSYMCPSTGVMLVANSPPLSSRGASVGGGRPPVHPPPPPPPAHPNPYASTSAVGTSATNSLAEAIAQLQAERRASEAGARTNGGSPRCAPAPTGPFNDTAVKAATAAPSAPATPAATLSPSSCAPQPPPPVNQATAAAVPAPVLNALAKPMASTAPKFCLDLAAGPAPNHGHARTRTSPTGGLGEVNTSRLAVSSGGSALQPQSSGESAASGPAVGVTRGAQPATQMVENVEDFINNILARPAARPTPVPASTGAAVAAAAVGQQQQQQPVGIITGAASRKVNAPARPAAPVASSNEAAAAVAGILASALRRPSLTSAKGTAANSGAPMATMEDSSVRLEAVQPLLVTAPRSMVHITAIAASDADQVDRATIELLDLDLNGKRLDLDFDSYGQNAKLAAKPLSESLPPVPKDASDGMWSPAKDARGVVPASPPVSNRSTGTYTSGNGVKAGSGSGRGSTSAASTTPAVPTAAGGERRHGSKRLSKRDYANWAAATPGFRAEAASKYGSSGVAPTVASSPAGALVGALPQSSQSPVHSAGGAARGSVGGGAGSSSVDACSSGGGASHSASAGPIWHVARGPDGSRGFAGRARGSPVAAV